MRDPISHAARMGWETDRPDRPLRHFNAAGQTSENASDGMANTLCEDTAPIETVLILEERPAFAHGQVCADCIDARSPGMADIMGGPAHRVDENGVRTRMW